MGLKIMEHKFDRVNAAISQLEEIQARQVESFDQLLMPDLETQTLEREQGFERVKQEVAGFIDLAGIEDTPDRAESMIRHLSDRISILLSQNETLTRKVNLHRDRLQDSMKGLVKGKKAIGAYGSPASVSNRPRAISFTN
jgi:hypothetical protein